MKRCGWRASALSPGWPGAAQGRELAGPLVTELAHDGDEAALEVLDVIGTNLGVALASFTNIFTPR